MDARAAEPTTGARPRVHSRASRAGGARSRRLALVGLTVLAVGVSGASLAVGAADVPFDRVVSVLAGSLGLPVAGSSDAWETTIVLQLRLPRLLLGLLVGSALALSGALMQGIFRNPLADPSLIGVSSGAALGAASMIVIGHRLLPDASGLVGAFLVPIAAFGGGTLATVVVHRLSIRNGRTAVMTMLLAGIAINALASAGTGLWTFTADDRELRDLAFWTLGSLAGASWGPLAVLAAFVAFGTAYALRCATSLDAMLLGEAEALHIGIDGERIRRRAVACTAAMVGSAVALSGLIFFVGLVVPHMIRLVAGPGHRFLLPASAILGGTLLVGADIGARLAVAPAELPIGIVTALVGAPFFLALVRRGGHA